ncbi:MAG: LysM peptidoglycan-binding domain-containing protein [Candidatus Gastranaerophilales bacterium]|nr:LysM peptidoglycan-binding domain-containing protein [Candidatus Gastranaerophilales bacterium]
MFKNKILASLLALTLAAAPMGGLGMTVSAAENDGMEVLAGTAVEEKVTLPEPTGVTWGDKYTACFDVIDGDAYLQYEAYRDGMRVTTGSREHNYISGTNMEVFALASFTASGELYYRLRWVQGDEVSPWTESSRINYVLPDKKVEGTTMAYWDDTTVGTVNFLTVDNAGDYQFWLYKWDQETENWSRLDGHSYSVSSQAGGLIRKESMTRELNRHGAGQYRVTVTVLSSDVDQWAHGEVGPMSDVYDTTVTASGLKETLSAAMASGDAVSAVNTLTAAADISAIRMAMQTDAEFRSQVQQLEEQYNRENNITTGTTVSDEAKEIVGSDAVQVIGAGFNGSENVTLEVDMASPEKQIPVHSGYTNPVQLDIKLAGVSAQDNLKMPVTITMPVPKGLDSNNLIILHSHADGQTEKVTFYNNGNGTVTFTVSSFSTFVFAQESAGSGSNDDTKEPSNGSFIDSTGEVYENTDNGDSFVSNGMEVYEEAITLAAPGAVITIPKSDGVNTLSNSVMRMLYERKDITLVMEYTYEGVDYRIVIPAGGAVYSDIPWYGPLYLAAHYGNGAALKNGTAVNGNYVIKGGDTLSKIAQANGLTVSQIAAMNPQIQDVNKIWEGQKITLK